MQGASVACLEYMERVLERAPIIKKLAKKYAKQAHYLYLGRKYNYPNALEGALKIKEIAYVPAQGYPTGEMKHGPIALIDSSVMAIMIALQRQCVREEYERYAGGARSGKSSARNRNRR
jgi:glucosamine 6-phosphate synthetase-like amidotransferase/phosphosugar isomerase protein